MPLEHAHSKAKKKSLASLLSLHIKLKRLISYCSLLRNFEDFFCEQFLFS